MKTLPHSLLFALGALVLAGSAFAQRPSANDTSDAFGNTGMGTDALNSAASMSICPTSDLNGAGCGNTASGEEALASNTTGSANTAAGFEALDSNKLTSGNSAFGYQTLYSNVGSWNTATGYQALYNNTNGDYNTAVGSNALVNNTIGNSNIAVGFDAGSNLTTGSNNIDIGNVGVAGESDLIRIGTKGTHKGAIIAGINSYKVTGSAVYVTTTGRLGVLASSERFKTAIAPMGSNTTKLEELRPVTFHLKTDPKGALQYGLIAEEVAKVYPELVIRDDSGKIDGVRYDELAPMLLNGAQQQAAKIRDLEQQVAALRNLRQQMAVMSEVLQKLQTQDQLVAQR